MLISINSLILLCVNIQIVLGYNISDNCGTVTVPEQAVEGQPLPLTFVSKCQPYVAMPHVTWLRLIPQSSKWTIIKNTSIIVSHLADSVYYLILKNVTDTDDTDYKVKVHCNDGLPGDVGDCETAPIRLNFTEQKHKDSGGYENDVENDVVDNDVVDNDDVDKNVVVKEDDDNEVNKHFSGTLTNRSDNPSPIIWQVVGASAVVVAFIIIGLVIKLFVRKTGDNSEINNAAIPTAEVDPNCPIYATVLAKSQRQTYADGAACRNDLAAFAENDESDDSTYEHDETTFAVNNDGYECDIPVSIRHVVLEDKQEKSNGLSKELIYADIDIQPSEASIRPRLDSPTEYVSIDFTKTIVTVRRDSST